MKITNNFNIPEPLLSAITGQNYPPKEKRLSVTSLVQSVRMIELKKRHYNELVEDVSDMVWRFLGSAVHSAIEKASEGKESEKYLSAQVDDYTISGKIDLIDNKIITDYKVTSAWSLVIGDKPEWYHQLNCYAWLCAKNDIEIEQLQIICIFKDWNKKEALNSPDYPQCPIKVIAFKPAPFEEADKFVKEKVKEVKEAQGLSDEALPVCSEADRWTKPTTWAVIKGENVRAARVLNTKEAAEKWMSDIQNKFPKEKYRIDERIGFDNRCKNFCNLSQFCSYFKQKYA